MLERAVGGQVHRLAGHRCVEDHPVGVDRLARGQRLDGEGLAHRDRTGRGRHLDAERVVLLHRHVGHQASVVSDEPARSREGALVRLQPGADREMAAQQPLGAEVAGAVGGDGDGATGRSDPALDADRGAGGGARWSRHGALDGGVAPGHGDSGRRLGLALHGLQRHVARVRQLEVGRQVQRVGVDGARRGRAQRVERLGGRCRLRLRARAGRQHQHAGDAEREQGVRWSGAEMWVVHESSVGRPARLRWASVERCQVTARNGWHPSSVERAAATPLTCAGVSEGRPGRGSG